MVEAKDTAVSALSSVASSNVPGTWGRLMLRGCLTLGAFIVLAVGSFVAFRLVENKDRIGATASPPYRDLMVDVPRPRTRLPIKPQCSLSLEEQVKLAIDGGLAYLRREHSSFNQYRSDLGLLGLTLLECGVPHDDPTVQQVAHWLRRRKNDLAQTYELAVAILFFDRLGDPNDRAILRTFGRRLLDGQFDDATWTYTCPLRDSDRSIPNGALTGATRVPQLPQTTRWPNAYPRKRIITPPRTYYRGDNCNTQFALLGLWVAQRYGMGVREALLSSEQYFRDTQWNNGSWGYHARVPTWCDSMTCAGLTSLAMRYGNSHPKSRDIGHQRAQVIDAAILRGLRYLDGSIDKVQVVGGRMSGGEARDPLFLLWSLERIAVMFDLKKIGDREWYPWAARMLVQTQQPNGCWPAAYPPAVGTCFALLVLKRSNLTSDLQLSVQLQSPLHRAGPEQPIALP